MSSLPDRYLDQIICGDSEVVLKDVPDESVDCMATDPPYGLTNPGAKNATGGFMGKSWDKSVPSVAIWEECLRVMKPGAFALVMCIPRQDCLARMIVNLEDAGFDVSFSSILHTFATGFNKSMNMGKKIDQRLGVEREVVGKRHSHYPDTDHGGDQRRPSEVDGWEAFGRGEKEVINQLSDKCVITTPATPEAKALDGSYSGCQLKPAYEVVLCVQKPFTDKHRRSDVYRMLGERYDYWYTQQTVVDDKNMDKLVKKWGRAFEVGDVIERRLALNPELQDEVILDRGAVLWSKPYSNSDLTSTITQALATGKSITWLDAGRIPYESDGDSRSVEDKQSVNPQEDTSPIYGKYDKGIATFTPQGRFSPNLLVSDDVLNDGVERKSGARSGVYTPSNPWLSKCREGETVPNTHPNPASAGSYSRYFSLDAWADKNLSESAKRTFPFLIVPKASKSEKNAGLDELEDKQKYKGDRSGGSHECFNNPEHRNARHRHTPEPTKNHHATVKPIKLMSYLISIGSRPGDVILDPFVGSGTTAVAAAILDRRYIGIELDAEMCDIAERRIKWHVEQAQKEAEVQPLLL